MFFDEVREVNAVVVVGLSKRTRTRMRVIPVKNSNMALDLGFERARGDRLRGK